MNRVQKVDFMLAGVRVIAMRYQLTEGDGRKYRAQFCPWLVALGREVLPEKPGRFLSQQYKLVN